MLKSIHHVAIICSDYEKSKNFYSVILGMKIISENYRQNRDSYKLDLKLPCGGQMELFSFPDSSDRPSYPDGLPLELYEQVDF